MTDMPALAGTDGGAPASEGPPSGTATGFIPRLRQLPDSPFRKILVGQTVLGLLLSVTALLVLGARAALRLDVRWDAPAYHFPFAALRGGLAINYDLNDALKEFYKSFPPLPDMLQGYLWWISGSINATGVINWLALILFLGFCQFCIGAPFWLVALVSLCAPLVIIHSAVSYVDLFANSLLAVGIAGCFGMVLLGERFPRRGLPIALAGLAGAAWSKMLLAPVVALSFLLIAVTCVIMPMPDRRTRLKHLGMVALAVVIATMPYIKNLEQYGNPFWPVKVPGLGNVFPHTTDAASIGLSQSPVPLMKSSRPELFVRSLLELGHPRRYPDRPRWIIDQGNAWIAYRSGGFWWLGTLFFLLSAIGMLVAEYRRRGIYVAGMLVGLLCFVAFLPQSHNFRYYLFLPLIWSAAIGLCFPSFSRNHLLLSVLLLAITAGFFLYMVSENRVHYRVERVGWREAARAWGADRYWESMKPGRIYCAVDLLPIGIFLTGPTMREFTVVDRSREELCPEGCWVITRDGIRPLISEPVRAQSQSLLNQSFALFQAGRYAESIEISKLALALRPAFAAAWNNIGASYMGLDEPEKAIEACTKSLEIDPGFGLARNNLKWAQDRVAEKRATPSAVSAPDR